MTVDGKRRKKSATSEAAAKRMLRDLLRDTDQGTTPSHGNITVASLLAQWSTNALPARNLRPRTIEVNVWAVNALTDMIGSKRLRGLQAADIEKAFQAADCSRESLIKLRSVLGKALDYALRPNSSPPTSPATSNSPPTPAAPNPAEPSPSNKPRSCSNTAAPDGSTRSG